MYNENLKNATLKYKREKQHPVSLSYSMQEWENLKPRIEASGIPIATYIKRAVYEKLENDSLWYLFPTGKRWHGVTDKGDTTT